MDYKKAGPKILLGVLWVMGLGGITAVLLGTGSAETGGFTYYLKLYGVGVLWLVFLIFMFGPRNATRIQVLPRSFDKAIMFLILAAVLVVLLAQLLRLLAGLQVFPAILLGLVSVGLFNVLRDMLAGRDT